MKKLILVSTIVIGCFTGCKKGAADLNSTGVSSVVEKPAPTASFRITNSTDNVVLEANILDFDVKVENADTYYWNFGNGVTSTEKVPTNFFYGICGSTNTISLVARNKTGKETIFSQSYTVKCTRGGQPHREINTITHH